MFFPIMAYVSPCLGHCGICVLWSFQSSGQRSLYPRTQVRFDNSQEILQAAQKSSLECVYQKLSCLAVCQPSRSLIGVAMAEGICVEWVSNSSVLTEVAHTASPLSLCRSSSRAHADSQNLGVHYCWLLPCSFSICNALSLISINTVPQGAWFMWCSRG